eukprot:jgi/Ulvmu1/4553/UM002_0281.1
MADLLGSPRRYEWAPDAPAHHRRVPERPASPASDHNSPRRLRRHIRASWSTEKIFLVIAFVVALAFGYVASTLLWQLDVLGTSINQSAWPAAPGKPTKPKPAAMDSVLGNVGLGTKAFEPPFTRAKYLEYFRSIAYGDASLRKHGGNRRVDIQMAAELSNLYSQHASVRASVKSVVEDDLWQEMRFNGQVPPEAHDVKLERALKDRLDVLITREKQYDPHAPAQGFLSKLKSPYAFQKEVEGSLTIHARRKMCPALEHDLGSPLDERRRMLFILGTQKGGTTYLFNALAKHKGFVGADHAYGQGKNPWAKEVHFFNRWPLPQNAKKEYLGCFPQKTWKLPPLHEHPHATNFTLVDATPDYMFNTMAAPRIKAMWPHAKFIVLLRDPIARAYSAWKMSRKMSCREQAQRTPTQACQFPSFAEMVLAEVDLLEKQGCAFNRKAHVFPKTWSECYSCKVTFPSKKTCDHSWRFNKQPCHAQPFLTLSVSMYAAQLSWWFGHFPKSRFMFINSDDLHGKDPLPILNMILDFAEVDGPYFQEKNLQNVWGYNGGYNKSEVSDLDLHTIKFLELFFRQADHDLKLLLSKTGYPGLKRELSHHSRK